MAALEIPEVADVVRRIILPRDAQHRVARSGQRSAFQDSGSKITLRPESASRQTPKLRVNLFAQLIAGLRIGTNREPDRRG
jgi:hypothetical protein